MASRALAISALLLLSASDGIGRAFAFRLAASGLSLALVGRNPDKLRDLAAAVRSRSPRVEVVKVAVDFTAAVRSRSPRVEVVKVAVDFAAPDLAEEGVRRLERAVAGLDVGLLVNSAGVPYPYARYFHEVEGVTRVTQALLPAMLERKRGAIVNIGSGAAIVIPSALPAASPTPSSPPCSMTGTTTSSRASWSRSPPTSSASPTSSEAASSSTRSSTRSTSPGAASAGSVSPTPPTSLLTTSPTSSARSAARTAPTRASTSRSSSRCFSCGEKVGEFKKSNPCLVVDQTRWIEQSFAVPA